MYLLNRQVSILSTLPEDVLLEISNHLDVEDVLILRSVRLYL